MHSGPRLRQVALVARDGERVANELQRVFDWSAPFHDPGVGEFGLTNSVFEVGDTFLEVVSPVRDDTTAGRYLERLGGDWGYMAIFQVDDLDESRRRIDELGVRAVWSVDLVDMATTHLHPRDVPGAIVSLDWADPPETWRWAGPRWIGGAPGDRAVGGICELTIASDDPRSAAQRWADVLDVAANIGDERQVTLELGDQRLRFVPIDDEGATGIVAVAINGPVRAGVTIGGVRFTHQEMT